MIEIISVSQGYHSEKVGLHSLTATPVAQPDVAQPVAQLFGNAGGTARCITDWATKGSWRAMRAYHRFSERSEPKILRVRVRW